MSCNKGNIYAALLISMVIIFVFLMFFGMIAYKTIILGELHTIKNDLYLINRNVLQSLQRDVMGEDINEFYEQEVKVKIEEEIKRQWNADVSLVTEKGFIRKIDVESAKIISNGQKMYIESVLNIQLRPIIFQDVLKDKLIFIAKEVVKVEKMKGWEDE